MVLDNDQEVGPEQRFHHLIAQAVEEVSPATTLIAVAEQKRMALRAARLLEDQGQSDDAVSLYRRVGEWEAVRALVLHLAPLLLAQGRGQTLREWIHALPVEQITRWPWVGYWLGPKVICLLVHGVRARRVLNRPVLLSSP